MPAIIFPRISEFNIKFIQYIDLLLLYYYYIFYKKNIITYKWQKRVSLELKSNFNTVSLAHLIKGDGNYLSNRNIIRIYTNSFTKDDVILLSNIINDNLNI